MNLPNENQFSIIQKYFKEVVLFALASVVLYLYIQYNSLNNFIKDEFIKKTVEMTITIRDNSKAIEDNTEMMKETQQLIKQSNQNK